MRLTYNVIISGYSTGTRQPVQWVDGGYSRVNDTCC